MALKRVLIKLLRPYISRRWAVRYARKLRWGKLWARVRSSVGILRGRKVLTQYDSLSYSRNFDDGSWKEEYLRSGSFGYRFGDSSRFVDRCS